MGPFLRDLVLKSYAVHQEFQSKTNEIDDIELNDEEKSLFQSMQRWHANGHMLDEDWLSCFDKVKDRLDVKERMDPMDVDFKSFLDSKFKASNIKEKFSVCEIFEFLVNKIKAFYDVKIEARDLEEENVFSIERIIQGLQAVDGTHYERVFLPSAIFFTYLEKHKNSGDRTDLMKDCFTVGAGSRQRDLFPEVTGLCRECKDSESFSDSDLDIFNKKVFKLQLKNKFRSNFRRVDSSEESDNDDTTHVGSIARWYNPFESDSDTDLSSGPLDKSTDSSTGKILQHPCNKCSKVFSKEEFLDFHKDCFHRTDGNKTRIVLVDSDISSVSCEESETPSQSKNIVGVSYPEPEELMVSFTQEPGPSKKTGRTIANKKSKRKQCDEQSAKDVVKRVLRFRK